MADADEVYVGEGDQPYNHAKSATDMGVYRKVGEEWTINHVSYPPDWRLVRRVRAEIDPTFVPLWITKFWESPNGGIVRTGYHVVGRCLPPTLRFTSAWKSKEPVHLRRPVGLQIPIPYPVLPCLTLDGVTKEIQDKGWPPMYVALDGAVVYSMRTAMWEHRNAKGEEEAQKRQAILDEKDASEARSKQDQKEQRRASRIRFRKPKVFISERQRTFTSERTSISNGLLRLRALAGQVAVGE